ncbi:MAG: helix-turn-helix transcriptional regulator [Deltaproteobacteria bacterium]|nr:helix-turn-helix transcriptional regulator [Deltaproteobacteria bacterium]
MVSLSSKDWMQLSRLWMEIARHPLADLDGAVADTLETLCPLVGADMAVLILNRRLREFPADDPLSGWRPIHMSVHGSALADLKDRAQSWLAQPPEILADGLAGAATAASGQTLVRRARDLMDEEAYRKTRGYAHAAALGVTAELVAQRPVAVNLEVCFVFYRTAGRFSDRDVALARAALDGLEPLCEHYVRSLGLLPGMTRLSPRERETLSYLLQGLPEKVVSDRLGLAESTTHQYVVAVYRKLGVSSRAELMSLWLSSSAAARQGDGSGPDV